MSSKPLYPGTPDDCRSLPLGQEVSPLGGSSCLTGSEGPSQGGSQGVSQGGPEQIWPASVAPLLENIAKSVGHPPADSEGSSDQDRLDSAESETTKSPRSLRGRWRLRGHLWDVTSLPRLQTCGRQKHGGVRAVQVRQRGDSVGYAGLVSCGSVWACPVCSAKVQAVRRLEVGVLVAQAAAQGVTVAFGTRTLRHKQGQPLGGLWEALGYAGQRIGQDRQVKRLRKELGYLGQVKVVEVTHGANGWHPHVHLITLFDGPVSDAELHALADEEFRAWKAAVKKRGFGLPLREHYRLTRVVDADVKFSDYFSKSVYTPTPGKDVTVPKKKVRSARSIAFEMTGSMTKDARKKGSRTQWDIAEEMFASGDADDFDLWEEFEVASKGKRAMTWTPGLKKRFKIAEMKDEEIVEQELGTQADMLFEVIDWTPVARKPALGAGLLVAVKKAGLAGGLRYAEQHGIPVQTPDGEEPDEDDVA